MDTKTALVLFSAIWVKYGLDPVYKEMSKTSSPTLEEILCAARIHPDLKDALVNLYTYIHDNQEN